MIKLTILVLLLAILYFSYKAYKSYKDYGKAKNKLSEQIIKGETLDVEAQIAEQTNKNKQKQTTDE